MGQILVRDLDKATMMRLDVMARLRNTSPEALARDVVRENLRLTPDEKLALVREAQAITERAKVPDVYQTPGVDLIREDRDR